MGQRKPAQDDMRRRDEIENPRGPVQKTRGRPRLQPERRRRLVWLIGAEIAVGGAFAEGETPPVRSRRWLGGRFGDWRRGRPRLRWGDRQ
jgi:hypothetical protein